MAFNHRGGLALPAGLTGVRFAELLEQLKAEYDAVHGELSAAKVQRDEYELKYQQQIQEMAVFQQAIFELDRQHQKVKQALEDENLRLRRDLGLVQTSGTARSSSNAPAPSLAAGVTSTPTQLAPLDIANGKRQRTDAPALPTGPASLAAPVGAAAAGTPTAGAAASAAAAAGEVVDKEQRANKRRNHGGTGTGPVLAGNGPGAMGAAAVKTAPLSPLPTSDFDVDTAPTAARKEGTDWMLIYNQKVTITTPDIDLVHSMDHASVVCCIKFSADSKYLATGCNRLAQIFDIATGAKVGEFSESAAREGDLYIRSVSFSPDGTLLATGAEDKQIRVWDIKKNMVKTVFSGHDQDIYSLDFSRDGKLVVSGSGDRTARIWSMETGKIVHVLRIDDTPTQKDAGITSVTFSPDGRYVAAGSLDRIVWVWDVKTGLLAEQFEGHRDSVYSVAFSPDGNLLVSGSLDRTLKLWDFGARRAGSKTNACKLTFVGHKDFVLSVCFSPDGKWIVSGSKDRSVQFWDPNNGTVHCVLQGHKNSVISVALSPDCQHFATGSGDLKARIWKYT